MHKVYCVHHMRVSVFHRVNHSKNAIVKPQAKHPDTAQREMEEAMKKVMEAQQLIDTAIEPAEGKDKLTINILDGILVFNIF